MAAKIPKMKKSTYPKKSTSPKGLFGRSSSPKPPTGLARQRVAPMKRARTVD